MYDCVVWMVQEFGVVVLCGCYEVIDQCLFDCCVDEEISFGDFVLLGGELLVMVMMDVVVWLLFGVLNDLLLVVQDSFVDGLFDCLYYMCFEEYDGVCVLDVLFGGYYVEIEKWWCQEVLRNMLWKWLDLIVWVCCEKLLSWVDEVWFVNFVCEVKDVF